MNSLRALLMTTIIGLASATLAHAQRTDKQILWLKTYIVSLRNKGLLVGYPTGFHSPKNPSKYELAVMANAVSTRYQRLWRESGEWPLKSQRLFASDLGWEAVQLIRLVRFVASEMKSFGAEPAVLIADIQQLKTQWKEKYPELAYPFPDVAPDHWATGAIANLRQAGILSGYPSGNFERD